MEHIWNEENLIKTLKGNGVAVMPTDTLYGVVGRAQNIATVERIYKIRKRAENKRCIILIGEVSELEKFSIILSEEQKTAINKYWFTKSEVEGHGPISIVLDCPDETLSYLHRGTKTLAFRLPSPQALRDLLMKTGPLIAPSANPEGLSPAQNITEARKYFEDLVDLYVDGGELKGKASKIIKLHKDGSISILRE